MWIEKPQRKDQRIDSQTHTWMSCSKEKDLRNKTDD